MSSPQNPQLELMSTEEIEVISRKNFENKQAQLRGEPAPHQISQDDLVRCLRSIRAMRLSGGQRPASKGKSTTREIDIDSIDI
jgi:hypothetical protein